MRAVLRFLFLSILLVVFGGLGYLALTGPDSPVPDAWNPTKPLNIAEERTPFTSWKLRRALASDTACLTALETGATFKPLPDFEASPQCHIRPQVGLSQVGAAKVAPVKTRCQTALRLALWERHGIQSAAREYLDTDVSRILHFSSFNCRAIRTSSGSGQRMSSHATGDAIDISGFILSDGRQISLKADWNGDDRLAAFLRATRDSACDWFRVTLGPDYNALHADHFHLQHTGWGLCR